MKVLVGCEFSGTVSDAFRAQGHEAWSCDLLPTEADAAWHIQGDVFDAVASRSWDLAVFHPPCTYLSSSGLHWNKRTPGRAAKTEAALAFVRALMDVDIPCIAIENPVGCIGTRIRPADQIIQPWQFGHDASKATCLWLKGLEPLVHHEENYVFPRIVLDRGKWALRWANQTASGQNKLPPSDDRWAERSLTYTGIAEAMARQWGGVVQGAFA